MGNDRRDRRYCASVVGYFFCQECSSKTRKKCAMNGSKFFLAHSAHANNRWYRTLVSVNCPTISAFCSWRFSINISCNSSLTKTVAVASVNVNVQWVKRYCVRSYTSPFGSATKRLVPFSPTLISSPCILMWHFWWLSTLASCLHESICNSSL